MNSQTEVPFDIQLWQLANQMIFIWSNGEYYPQNICPSFRSVWYEELSFDEFIVFMKNQEFETLLEISHAEITKITKDNQTLIEQFYTGIIPLYVNRSNLNTAQRNVVLEQNRKFYKSKVALSPN